MVNSNVLNLISTDLNSLQAILMNTFNTSSLESITSLADLFTLLSSSPVFAQALSGLVKQVLMQSGVDTSLIEMMQVGQFINLDLTSTTPGYRCPTCVDCELSGLSSTMSIQNCSKPGQVYCQVEKEKFFDV
jgi:hypothetical protein